MDNEQSRERILEASLPHIGFDGWCEKALRMGVIDAGFEPSARLRLFPGGIRELLRYWSAWSDRQMLMHLQSMDLEPLPMRRRVAEAVQARIRVNGFHREAVRRSISYMALPLQGSLAMETTYATINAIWYAAGDRSTDFRFYTKRAALAAVYAATVLYWLDDSSDDWEGTWAFLDRRIDGAMAVPQLGQRAAAAMGAITRPIRSVAARPDTTFSQ